MKDRIKQVMESLHLTQQEFAERTQIGAATLSNIFNDRTRPSLNVLELIKKNIPEINLDWLILGVGSMYVDKSSSDTQTSDLVGEAQPQSLPFEDYPAPTPLHGSSPAAQLSQPKFVRNEINNPYTPIPEKPQRKVTEIRVYYDDQTWESFLPSKSKS